MTPTTSLEMMLLALGVSAHVTHAQVSIHGCACLGEVGGPQGPCGYHFNWDHGAWDKPWCRCSNDCQKQGYANYDPEGIWMYCKKEYAERRRANDGKLYDAKEFREYYGSTSQSQWDKLSHEVERRLSNDKVAYTVSEFRNWYVAYYGENWVEAWMKADPEKRQANDGRWYSFDDFAHYYGEKNALRYWREGNIAEEHRRDEL